RGAGRLAVFRRPQSRTDQVALYRNGNDLPPGVVDPGSVRSARRTPWGAPVLLGVNVRGRDRGRLVLGVPTHSNIVQLSVSLEELVTGRGTVAVIGTKAATRVVFVAGDGIARVRVALAGGASRTGRAIGNVAPVPLPTRSSPGNS